MTSIPSSFSRLQPVFWVLFWLALAPLGHALVAAGWPVAALVAIALGVLFSLLFAVRSAWRRPQQFSGRRLLGFGLLVFASASIGVAAATMIAAPGPWSGSQLLSTLGQAAPQQLVAAIVVLLLVGLPAMARSRKDRREIERLKLVHERDAAARQASEAQLKLLRAQIQPHFIFNTLSAVQHWVDTADPRASGLLRELTAFLRQSTELLAQPAVSLRDEAGLLGHYLAVMQARLGDRLQYRLALDPATLDQLLPAGLLVTLAENALEHGVAPALHGGRVAVSSQRDGRAVCVMVLNTGEPLREGWREGIGLANIRERLRHQFGERSSLSLRTTAEGTEALVRLEDEA